MPMENFSIQEENHGDYAFPCFIWHERIKPAFPSGGVNAPQATALYCHWHNDAEFLRIERGHALLYINDKKYDFPAGSIMYINPHDLHMLFFAEGVNLIEFTAVVFHPDLLQGRVGSIINAKYINPIIDESWRFNDTVFTPNHPLHARLNEVFSQMDRVITHQPEGYELAARGLVGYALSILIEGGYFLSHSHFLANSFIHDVILYVEEHYHSPIKQMDVAKALGYSRNYFCSLFKKHFHTSFTHFVNALRIQKARQLMDEGENSITRIAFQVGFSSQAYFSTVFSQQMHIAPTAYLIAVRNTAEKRYQSG